VIIVHRQQIGLTRIKPTPRGTGLALRAMPSIGGNGLTVNLKDGKTKTTASVPGTGLSYSETSTGTTDDPATEQRTIPAWIWLLIAAIIALMFLVKYNQ